MTEKEITMDYKKRYKNALNIARDYHSKGYMMINTAIETIFPELKESEDERIKNRLIKLIKMSSEVGGFALHKWEADEMIAWLEKQREEPKKVSIWKHWKDGIAGDGEGEPIYLVKYGNTYSISSCLGFECDYIELSELDNLLLEKQELLKKMHEADYEWDADLKELRKIETDVTIDIDKLVESYANNKEPGNEEFGKPVPCMIRAYRQGINDVIKKVEQRLGVKKINIS